ncbi:hypothetical protein [Aeromicrobium sp. Sec7.5]
MAGPQTTGGIVDEWLGLIVATLVLLEAYLLAVVIYPVLFERGSGQHG